MPEPPRPGLSLEQNPNRRLDGWKDISAHLGRGIRTVQRWERDLVLTIGVLTANWPRKAGLPVATADSQVSLRVVNGQLIAVTPAGETPMARVEPEVAASAATSTSGGPSLVSVHGVLGSVSLAAVNDQAWAEDVDGDGRTEVLLARWAGQLVVFNADGTLENRRCI